MFEMIRQEFRFFFQTKRCYIYQTVIYDIERIIFLIGMISLVTIAGNLLNVKMILKIGFWFSLINSFAEISKRIESEMRLKQFQHCYHLKVSYWTISFMRLIPILIESLLIVILSFIFLTPFVKYVIDISLSGSIIYLLLAIIQYYILNFLFILLVLYFQRVQAVLGFVESFTFFYSGMVLFNERYQLFLFRIMDQILYNNFSSSGYLIIYIALECIILKLGIIYLNQIVRKGI